MDRSRESSQVLVTGATGFIGRRLATELLERGDRVYCLVRRPEQAAELEAEGAVAILGDLSRPETLRDLPDFDFVYHLGGVLAARRADEFERVNVDGCRHLYEALAAAERPPARVVHVSSIAAGGPAPGPSPRHEDDPPAPVSLYGRSKLRGEEVARSFMDRLPIVVLRPAVVYGPEDQNLLPIFRMANRGLVLKPPEQPKLYSMVHVADLARLLLRAAETDALEGGTYHVAVGQPCTWDRLVGLVGEACGRRPRQISLGRLPYAATAWFHAAQGKLRKRGRVDLLIPQKLPELYARFWNVDTGKLWHHLNGNGVATTPLGDGLRETAEWYRANGWL